MSWLPRRLFSVLLIAFALLHSSPGQKPPAPSAAKAAAVQDADKLDINTATPAQLKALKGIGDAYTKRIVEGRPYTAKNQLVTRGVVPQATYDGIKDRIIARAVKK
jgi:DNA uptake protein ComE-like DNA-binding protein